MVILWFGTTGQQHNSAYHITVIHKRDHAAVHHFDNPHYHSAMLMIWSSVSLSTVYVATVCIAGTSAKYDRIRVTFPVQLAIPGICLDDIEMRMQQALAMGGDTPTAAGSAVRSGTEYFEYCTAICMHACMHVYMYKMYACVLIYVCNYHA